MAEGSDNKKKWLMFGCGGCLVVLLIVVGLLFAAGSWFQKMGSESSQGIFGEKYQPKGYTTVPVPVGTPGGSSVAMVSGDAMILTIKTPIDADSARIIGSGNAGVLKGYMEGVVAPQLNAANQQGSNGKISLEKMEMIRLANGKSVPASIGTLTQQTNGQTVGLVVMLVPQPENQVVYMMGMGMKRDDIARQQASLQSRMIAIITDSDIDDRMP